MTEDERIARVRSALEKIGPLRETLLTLPNYLFPGPARYGSKGECGKAKKFLSSIETALKEQRNAFNKLPTAAAESMPFKLEGLIEAIDKVSLLVREAEYEHETIWGGFKSKRGKNVRAYFIADEIAKHYAHSKFKKPTIGHNNGKPSTEFTKAVAEVFGIVGVKADFGNPCSEAVDKITPEFIEDARGLKHYRAAVALRASGVVAPEPTLLGQVRRMEMPTKR